MATADNQPDWDKIAEKFDLWLPHIAPAGEAMLQAAAVKPGDLVLDVASGTGEPALTLAKRMGDAVNIIGTDAAAGMVRVAKNKAETTGLANIRFECMPAEHLDFPDEHFDVVFSRFGVMLFQDSEKGLKEMCRVLKPDGRFALTVWHSAQTMPVMHWTYEVFKDKIPAEAHPPLQKMVSLGEAEVLEGMLRAAGFSHIEVTTAELVYEFDSFDAFWDTVEASEILQVQLNSLTSDRRTIIRDEVKDFAQDFISDGGFHVPHTYVLASGKK